MNEVYQEANVEINKRENIEATGWEKRRETPVLYSVFFALLTIGLLGIIFANLRLFTIKSVVVQGNRTVSDEAIIWATRIARNQNLFSLRQRQVQTEILRNPYIAKANLRVVLPNRVVIRVVERHPVCLAKCGEICYLIGNDRAVLGAATSADTARLPVLDGLPVMNLEIGKPIKNTALDQAFLILKDSGRELRPLLSRLDMAHYRLELKYPGNPNLVTVELGNAERLTEKIANLRAVLAKSQFQNAVRIDLRVPEILTVTAAQK